MKDGELVLKCFLQNLSDISLRFQDVTDTDVREALFRVINFHFIWDLRLPSEPKRFMMLNPDGDRAVATAVNQFFLQLSDSDASLLSPGIERHNFIHNHAVRTDDGLDYERFLGTGELTPPKVPLPTLYFTERATEHER